MRRLLSLLIRCQIRCHAYNALQMLPVIELSNANGIVTEAYSALTPLTRMPGGKAVPVAERVARRLGVETGQAILDWLKTKGVVAVTCVSFINTLCSAMKEFRKC